SKLTVLLLVLASLPSFATTKIACVGNSITAGYGLNWQEDYPTQWQDTLGSNYTVSNFGYSGATLLKTGSYVSYWSTGYIANALAATPDVIIVELGTNDANTSYSNWYSNQDVFPEDYKDLIDTFQTLSPAPQIWICLAPYANYALWNILDTSLTLRINPQILQVGLDMGLNVIDLHSTFTNKSWYASDSVHPNAEGAKALASIINSFYQRDNLTATQSGNVLTAPSGYAYQWYLNDSPISGDTNQTLTISTTGTYKVSVKVDAGNDSRIVSADLVVSSLSGVTVVSSSSQGSHTVSSSSSFDASSSTTTRLAMEETGMTQVSLSGRLLRILLPKTQPVMAKIYDVQGHLLREYAWEGNTGENLLALPASAQLQIVRIQTGKQTQSFLYSGD
ncbi:MAG TPA: GDSL-type esterase/lipase family protein, partial [Fibrobacteraceae bacterium]|nr:GDSL-type esterase/lipase family protein [Fibrobacteraceae bacterium]